MKILIADDHALIRKGLIQILQDDYSNTTIDEATNYSEVLKKIRENEYSIVISDISMPANQGLDLLKQIKILKPALPVLLLSIHSEEQYAIRALKAGAAGYLSKASASDELISAVSLIMKGKKYVSPAVAQLLATKITSNLKEAHELLSDREFEVTKLIAGGKTVSEIAKILSLSIPTISTYRTRILEKLKLKNNAELMHYAMEHGLV